MCTTRARTPDACHGHSRALAALQAVTSLSRAPADQGRPQGTAGPGAAAAPSRWLCGRVWAPRRGTGSAQSDPGRHCAAQACRPLPLRCTDTCTRGLCVQPQDKTMNSGGRGGVCAASPSRTPRGGAGAYLSGAAQGPEVPCGLLHSPGRPRSASVRPARGAPSAPSRVALPRSTWLQVLP